MKENAFLLYECSELSFRKWLNCFHCGKWRSNCSKSRSDYQTISVPRCRLLLPLVDIGAKSRMFNNGSTHRGWALDTISSANVRVLVGAFFSFVLWNSGNENEEELWLANFSLPIWLMNTTDQGPIEHWQSNRFLIFSFVSSKKHLSAVRQIGGQNTDRLDALWSDRPMVINRQSAAFNDKVFALIYFQFTPNEIPKCSIVCLAMRTEKIHSSCSKDETLFFG